MIKKIIKCSLFFIVFCIAFCRMVGMELENVVSSKGGNIEFLYCHGIASTGKQVEQYTTNNLIPESVTAETFDHKDVTQGFWRVNFWNTGFGAIEVDSLREAYKTVVNIAGVTDKNDKRLVLIGLSRGASAIVSFMAGNPDKIEALILESPFDSFDSILKNLLAKVDLDGSSTALWLAQQITKLIFWKYDPNQSAPVDHVVSIPNKELPILLICSQDDTLVPCQATLNLFLAFKNNGFTKVHCALLNGKHGKICLDSDALEIYKQVIHAFYKQYNLPYEQQFLHAQLNLDALCVTPEKAQQIIKDKAAIQRFGTNTIIKLGLITALAVSVYAMLNYMNKQHLMG